MPLRFYIFFTFFATLFLLYPGDSYYFNIFAHSRDLFAGPQKSTDIKVQPVPYARFAYPPDVTASGVYIVDLPSFTPVFERNLHMKFYPASMTKVITALVAHDLYDQDEVIEVGRVISEGQVMGLVPGERITVEHLLYGLLVHSGNDAAYALADHHGFEKFVELMNKKAKDLHMTNSNFVNPAGLDEDNLYSTPYDLALAARELLKNKYLSKIVSTKEITIADEDFKYFHKLSNINKLLGEIQGIGGLKTGFTEAAGENLISFYKRGGHQFVIVLVKSEDRFEDTRNIVDWIERNVAYL